MKIYVEGGGDYKALRTECRRGFSEFLKKAGLIGHMPRIVACGSRESAFNDFCTAQARGESAMLLVDSEDAVGHHQAPFKPWHHLFNRQGDKWQTPARAHDDDCHLMVQCMEAWFLVDRQALQQFFGQGFDVDALPLPSNIEFIGKQQIYQILQKATKNCKTKSTYGKGEHSFKLLAEIDPGKVTAASPWAKRLVDELTRRMKG